MITVSSEWESLSFRPGKLITAVQISYGPGTSVLYVATEDVTIEGIEYIGVLKGVPTVGGSMDWRKKTSSLGGTALVFDNAKWDRLERPSDWVEDTSLGSGSDVGFFGRLAEVKFFREGISSWANCFPHFAGIMEPAGHDRDTFTINVTDKGDEIKNRKVAGEKITSADLTAYDQTQGDGELNASKPSVIGDKKTGFCSTDASLTDFVRPLDGFKMRFLGTQSQGETIYLISDRQIDMQEAIAYRIWAKDTSVNRFVELRTASWEIIQNDDNGCVIRVLGTAQYWDYRRTASVSKSESSGGDGSGVVTNEENMADQDNATNGTLAVTDSTIAGVPHARVTVGYEVMEDPESSIPLTYAVFARSSYAEGGATAAIFEINGIDASGNSAANYNAYGTVGGGSSSVLFDVTGEDSVEPVWLHTATIYESYLRVQFRPIEVLDHYAFCGGGEYRDWINGRTGHQDDNAALVKKSGNDLTKVGFDNYDSPIGGFTAAGVAAGDILILDDTVGGGRLKIKSKISDTRVEVYSQYAGAVGPVDFSILTNKVVENPAGAQEYVLREYGALVDADIDEVTFNTASVVVAILKAAAGILNESLVPRVLAEMGEAFGLFPFWGGANQYKCVAMKSTYVEGDIDAVLPYADEKKFDFRGKTKRIDLKVASVVEYGWDGEEFTGRTDGSVSTANETKYNLDAGSAGYTLSTRFISERASADTQETYNLNLRMQRNNLPKINMGMLYLALEQGDIVAFSGLVDADGLPILVNGEDVEQVSYTRNGQTIYGMFMVMGYRRNRRIALDGFQLKRLD